MRFSAAFAAEMGRTAIKDLHFVSLCRLGKRGHAARQFCDVSLCREMLVRGFERRDPFLNRNSHHASTVPRRVRLIVASLWLRQAVGARHGDRLST